MKKKQAFLAIALGMVISMNAQNDNGTAPPKVSSGKEPVQAKANDADLAQILASPEYTAIVKIMSKDQLLEKLSTSTLHEVTKLANALTTLNDTKAHFWAKGKAALDLAPAVTILYIDKKPTIYKVIVTLHNNIGRVIKNPLISADTRTALEVIAAKLKDMGKELNKIDNLGKLLTDSNHIKKTIDSITRQLVVIGTIVENHPTIKAIFNAFLNENKIKPMIKQIQKKATTINL